jgi:hypothetical protein
VSYLGDLFSAIFAKMTGVKKREWVEICVPFSGRGFKSPVTGVLTCISPVVSQGKQTFEYQVRRKDGTLFSFVAVLDLDQIVKPHHIGHWMCIKLDAFYASPNIVVWTTREREWLCAPRKTTFKM